MVMMMQIMERPRKINKIEFLPDESKVHSSKDGEEQERDSVWLVEEIQVNVLDGSFIHRQKRWLC